MTPEDRLDTLLARRLSGVSSLDAPLDYDDALEPLLAAAGALQPLRDARPSAAFTATLEERLLAVVTAKSASHAPDPAPLGSLDSLNEVSATAATTADLASLPNIRPARTVRPARPMRRPRILWPAIAAAVLLLAFGVLTAAAAAGPGSPLYGLHRIEQSVHVALAGNPADRMRLHLSYASDALIAANAAAHAGDNATFGDALATLRSELAAASSELANIPPGGDYDTLSAQLVSLRSRVISNLRSDLPPLSWSSRLAATDALAAFGNDVPRVTGATAQRARDASTHSWHVVITGSGFAPGAQLLVNGQPAGTVVSVTTTTFVADYTAPNGESPGALGVANPDATAAQTQHITVVPPGQDITPGPTNTPGAGSGGDHGGGTGKGGHGGGHGTPTPNG